MDDALKARLIGATVLVVLAVLLIPELLSGKKPVEPAAAQAEGARGTRTFTIELGGPPQATSTAAPPAPAVRPAPVATPERGASAAESVVATAAAGQEPAQGSRKPVAQPETPPAAQAVSAQTSPAPSAPERHEAVAPATVAKAPAAAPVPSPASPAPSIPAKGGWAVQVGAFSSPETASKLVKELQTYGYRAYVSPVSRAGKPLHRVRVGPEPERARAESLVAGLKARGLPATVVAND
jgi:DedD protein